MQTAQHDDQFELAQQLATTAATLDDYRRFLPEGISAQQVIEQLHDKAREFAGPRVREIYDEPSKLDTLEEDLQRASEAIERRINRLAEISTIQIQVVSECLNHEVRLSKPTFLEALSYAGSAANLKYELDAATHAYRSLKNSPLYPEEIERSKENTHVITISAIDPAAVDSLQLHRQIRKLVFPPITVVR